MFTKFQRQIFTKKLHTAILFFSLIGNCFSAIGENMPNVEIEPFVGKDFLKEPESICEYDDINAACDQLLIYLYRRDDRIVTPKKEDILHLEKIVTIIKEHGGVIVGQIQGLAIIQIEIRSKEKLLNLKEKLEESGYVQSVNFNITSKLLDSDRNSQPRCSKKQYLQMR